MIRRNFPAAAAMTFLLLLGAAAPTTAPAYPPTSDYQKKTIEGWTVYVNKDLMADADLSEKVLALLRVKLFDITRVVPTEALHKIQNVAIWIDLNDPGFPCMCYHPSADWLRDNGYNPDKGRGVEISNAHNFLTWSLDQPWMVLHELAHAYHDQVFGFDDPKIKAVYDHMMKSHRYEAVLHINGQTVRHYAMTNVQEYFAESSEAFFGTNDYYPFVRAELADFDPRMYDLLQRVWGTKQAHKSDAPAAVKQ